LWKKKFNLKILKSVKVNTVILVIFSSYFVTYDRNFLRWLTIHFFLQTFRNTSDSYSLRQIFSTYQRVDPLQKNAPFFGWYVFGDFFHKFLRWCQNNLRCTSRGSRGLSGRMPFPDTKHINWSFWVDFVQNRKFLTNRNTVKKIFYGHKI
jgi:hypothetical protein